MTITSAAENYLNPLKAPEGFKNHTEWKIAKIASYILSCGIFPLIALTTLLISYTIASLQERQPLAPLLARLLAPSLSMDASTLENDPQKLIAAQQAQKSCANFKIEHTNKAAILIVKAAILKVTYHACLRLAQNKNLSEASEITSSELPLAIEGKCLHLIKGSKLGRGGYGIIYETFNLISGQFSEVAVKIAQSKKPEYQKKAEADLEKEVVITQKLNPHGNTRGIQLPVKKFTALSVGAARMHVHYGPKFGIDLYAIYDKKALVLTKDEKRIVAIDLFSGLAHAHANNVTHGDIKLENINFDKKRQEARLADWGGAIDHDKAECLKKFIITASGQYRSQQDLTTTSGLLHNINHETDPHTLLTLKNKLLTNEKASDVFAACMIIVEIYTNKSPFKERNLLHCITQPSPDENLKKILANEKLSPNTIALIYKGLQSDSTLRPTAQEILNALQEE